MTEIEPDWDIVQCKICWRMFDDAHIQHWMAYGWRGWFLFHWKTYREIRI